ncbi:FecR family protein [Chitinophaga ginsengisegetis]|uniref:FecR family protein n=1 Tax=Chitinophaga ginsengisegetis TaxID=393003 RepID=A0A1T5PAZ5_9BACT|nr:FecR family protein [Chitinophaga ginsengisegetis]SKD09767.1 FecR family protein [Chitinophaga ginsengisegetis]
MNETRLSYLFKKLLDQSLSPAEKEELGMLIEQQRDDAPLEELIQQALEDAPVEHRMDDQATRQVLDAIRFADSEPALHVSHRRSWLRTAAAAAVFIAVAATAYYYWPVRSGRTPVVKVEDVQPGGNKALLTLADGRVVALDSSSTQTMQQGAASIHKQGGQLVYTAARNSNQPEFNTLRTPRGGQFKVQLPDGTNVWLNAASSLRYPTDFNGTERLVQVSGEAFFEVAKDAARPFRVAVSKHHSIIVLGTRFNVKAYNDDAIAKTTLLDGAVKVTFSMGKVQEVQLQPGQQAQVSAADETMQLVKQVNLDQEMAWRSDAFSFEGQTLEEIMKQISRWYDIDVVFPGKVPDISFGGGMSREVNLKEVLDFLRDSRVHYKLESNGKKLIITQ